MGKLVELSGSDVVGHFGNCGSLIPCSFILALERAMLNVSKLGLWGASLPNTELELMVKNKAIIITIISFFRLELRLKCIMVLSIFSILFLCE